jgi:hypothetical protein
MYLGVQFDATQQESNHTSKVISKANRALNAIELVRRYFNTKELLQLLTSNYFPILYFKAEVWQLNSLKGSLKQMLLSASANAIKVAHPFKPREITISAT